MTAPVRVFLVGERVTLRKAHPCGSSAWRIDRVGADVGLVCEGCGRRLLLDRRELEARALPAVEDHG